MILYSSLFFVNLFLYTTMHPFHPFHPSHPSHPFHLTLTLTQTHASIIQVWMSLWSENDVFRRTQITPPAASGNSNATTAAANNGSSSSSSSSSRGPRQETFRLLTHGTVDCTFTSWSITVKREISDESDDEA